MLDIAWKTTTEHWTDRTARHFAHHHWQPLDAQTRAYSDALHRMLDLLTAAERATDY